MTYDEAVIRARRTTGGRRSRRGAIATVAVAVVLLAACDGPIVVTDEGVSSRATRVVRPTTTQVRGVATPAIAIRMRSCTEVQLRVEGVDADLRLQPHAKVIDASGRVLYWSHDFPDEAQVRPAGSSVDPDAGGAHQVIVPVVGGRTPLEIRTWCDSYVPGSHGMYPSWSFPVCRTSTRRCTATTPGTGTWSI